MIPFFKKSHPPHDTRAAHTSAAMEARKAAGTKRDKMSGDREKCWECQRDARKGDAMVYCEACDWGAWSLAARGASCTRHAASHALALGTLNSSARARPPPLSAHPPGFHQSCLSPSPLTFLVPDERDVWYCRFCLDKDKKDGADG